jgi:hypothetical protein
MGWSRYGVETKKTRECERDEFLRAACWAFVAGRIDAQRPVFVTEMGLEHVNYIPPPWSPRGRRALARVARNGGPNVMLLSSMSEKA